MGTDVLPIGPRADALITNEETGGQAYYERTEMHPDWPGGGSGVTIGDGYDLGMTDAATIRRDWGPYLPASMVEQLASVAGIHGRPAQSHAHELHNVIVPWAAALAVFHDVDVPKWSRMVASVLPNCELLPPDAYGALVSIAFNRGNAWNAPGDRYLEMRQIKALMTVGHFAAIPAQIRAMKRHWPPGTSGHADLTARREHEAVLFEQALGKPAPAVPAPPVLQPSPAMLVPPAMVAPAPAPVAPPKPAPRPALDLEHVDTPKPSPRDQQQGGGS